LEVEGCAMAKLSKNKRARRTREVKRVVNRGSLNGRKKLPGQFFASSTLAELAEAQGVGPMKDPEQMAGAWPEEEDVDQFVRETYQSLG
jgi:hypothetical protein